MKYRYEDSDRNIAGKKYLLVSHITEKKSYRPKLLHMKPLIDKCIPLILRQRMQQIVQ
jgi:hypothetical protein